MTIILYIDILFLVNWMMDAVLLIVTGRMLRRKIRLGRVSGAAAAAAAGGCLYTILSWKIGNIKGIYGAWKWMEVVLHGSLLLCYLLLLPAFMVRFAYPTKEWRELLRGCLCLYVSAVLLGGLIHVVYDNTALGRFWRLWMAGRDTEAISIWLLAGALAGSFIAIECGRRYRHASRNRERIQEVTLYYGGRQRTVQALWDSGNQLQDPFTGQVVHILQSEDACELLGEEIYRYVMGEGSPAPLHEVITEKESIPYPRWIPCRSLGSAHTLLPVISISRLQLADGQVLEAPLIGLSSVPLSGDGGYQMLLHAKWEDGSCQRQHSQTDEMRRKPNNGH